MNKSRFHYAATERAEHGDSFRYGLDLYENKPDICTNRHKGNPESVEAFQSVKDRLTSAQKRVFDYIVLCQGATVDEIAIALDKTPNSISGRVTELLRDGKIKREGRRKTRSGCMAAILKAV